MSGRGSVCKSILKAWVGEGKGQVQFLKEKCRKSVGSSYGESKV